MDIKKLYLLIEDFFGYKVKMLYLNSEKKEVACILYDSFLFKCGFEERYGIFESGIIISENEAVVTSYLGESFLINSDTSSIKKTLTLVDNYCRLRLPDKFLDAFDEAYKNN